MEFICVFTGWSIRPLCNVNLYQTDSIDRQVSSGFCCCFANGWLASCPHIDACVKTARCNLLVPSVCGPPRGSVLCVCWQTLRQEVVTETEH